MKFNLVFTQSQIAPAKQAALKKISQHLTLKGFRPGKAPLDRVEQHVDQEQLIEETASVMLPEAYSAHITKHQLKPITQPKISLKKMVTDGDWEFEVEIAERPEVKLNDYQAAIKKEKAANPKVDDDSKKLNLVLDALLKTTEVDVPALLIDEEVNHSLSHLLEQVEKLGLKLDQYLTSIGKTAEALRKDYEKSAADNLKLEFVFDAIAKDQKLAASDAQVDQALAKTDPDTAQKVKASPVELASLKYALVKQQVVDFLLKL